MRRAISAIDQQEINPTHSSSLTKHDPAEKTGNTEETSSVSVDETEEYSENNSCSTDSHP